MYTLPLTGPTVPPITRLLSVYPVHRQNLESPDSRRGLFRSVHQKEPSGHIGPSLSILGELRGKRKTSLGSLNTTNPDPANLWYKKQKNRTRAPIPRNYLIDSTTAAVPTGTTSDKYSVLIPVFVSGGRLTVSPCQVFELHTCLTEACGT